MSDQSTTAEAENQQTTATQTGQGSEQTAADTGVAETGAGAAETSGTVTGAAEQGGSQESAATTSEGDDKGELQRLREVLAGGDEKLLSSLERYKSVDAISKAFKEARNAAKNAGKPLALSDKATPEEVKAYREAMGIPEEAKDYPVSFREGYEASDQDKAILESFKSYLHEKNADPRAGSAALEWYQDFAQAQQQELSANLAKVAKETQAALRNEWGGEYDGNIGAAAELMTSHLGEEGFGQMMGLRLMDGSRLQDHAPFVKMMAQIGSDYYGGNAIMTGDIETTSKTLQERKDELMALRASDSAKYFSDEVQGKLQKINAQLSKIGSRK